MTNPIPDKQIAKELSREIWLTIVRKFTFNDVVMIRTFECVDALACVLGMITSTTHAEGADPEVRKKISEEIGGLVLKYMELARQDDILKDAFIHHGNETRQ
jgi:hypothetical protein